MAGRHTVVRKCSEPDCRAPLVYPDDHARAGEPKPSGTKTCSQRCRQKRATRVKARQAKQGRGTKHAPAVQDMAAVTQGHLTDVVHEVMVDELRPLVREAMTEEVLRSINLLVGMTAEGIAALQQDLSAEDDTIRQRAYTLLLKYTMGNPSVAPPPTHVAPSPMTVQFNIPRPGDPTDTTPAVEPAGEAEELRQCTDCSQHKPESEFVGASPRCQVCFDGLHATLAERFAVDDDTAPDNSDAA